MWHLLIFPFIILSIFYISSDELVFVFNQRCRIHLQTTGSLMNDTGTASRRCFKRVLPAASAFLLFVFGWSPFPFRLDVFQPCLVMWSLSQGVEIIPRNVGVCWVHVQQDELHMGALLPTPSVAGTGGELLSTYILWPPPQCWLAQGCQMEGTPPPPAGSPGCPDRGHILGPP